MTEEKMPFKERFRSVQEAAPLLRLKESFLYRNWKRLKIGNKNLGPKHLRIDIQKCQSLMEGNYDKGSRRAKRGKAQRSERTKT